MRRRTFLQLAAAVPTSSLGLAVAGCGNQSAATTPVPVNEVAFATALAVPPLAKSTVDGSGTRTFQVTAQAGTTRFGAAVATPTWGFNGSLLGPTLRAGRGEQVAVEVRNELDEATSCHWHGMHLPAEMDGGPHQLVEPGQTWRPTWRIEQPAATLWYHPHPHGQTERHVYQGLAGMFIIDDPDAEAALPSSYGVDDIPVIVQDKQFDDEGRLSLEGAGTEPGLMGSVIMVNGTIGAYLDVTTELLRLRVLNGSTARVYNVGFDDERPFHLVGTDGGLLQAPHQLTRLRLSPGERAEIVVRLDPGETVRLNSDSPHLGRVALPGAYGGEDVFHVLELRAAAQLTPSQPLPTALAEVARMSERDATVTREFEVAVRMINGRRMDPTRIDEVVRVGTTEIWEVRSIDAFTHNFHVHDVQFQVLDVDGSEPPPELRGWKDTVYLEPQQRLRLIMRFAHYTDPDTPYMYHCHLLRHEDEGLMGQFLVVADDEQPATTLPDDGHGH